MNKPKITIKDENNDVNKINTKFKIINSDENTDSDKINTINTNNTKFKIINSDENNDVNKIKTKFKINSDESDKIESELSSKSGFNTETSSNWEEDQQEEQQDDEIIDFINFNINDAKLDLKNNYEKYNCNDDENYYSNKCNKFLFKKELLERKVLSENEQSKKQLDKDNIELYPNLNDPKFNIKIASKKEFNDTKYDGTIYEDIKKHSDMLANANFELQPHQAFVKNFMSLETPYSSLLLYHGLGTGKCMKKGTPILMYDGTIKLIEDIKECDILMGDDSTPRKVLSLAKGKDKMYDIMQIKGEKYTVNQEHILCLKVLGFPKLCKNIHKSNINYTVQWIENNQFKYKTYTLNGSSIEDKMKIESELFFQKIKSNILTNNNIFEISVKDYLNLSNKKKSLLKGYKVSVNFPEKEVPFEPYMFGYWLGNNTASISEITCQDSTVLYYFAKNLPKYKLSLQKYSEYVYSINLQDNDNENENIFLTMLKNLNLINNKHIPLIFKCNSRETRLKLLAGLLDSNGYLNKKNNVFEFSQTNENLLNDVIYLARSLGFACYKNKNKNNTMTNKSVKINISGIDLENIPTQISSKKSISRKQCKDVLITGIDVKYVGDDDYYGFTLDGNCRYVLGDFTVSHNTCSSIGVCEDMRDYMKQVNINKRIIIVASENVQDNFKLQLFDERKLVLVNNVWTITGCVGNKLLKEINPMNIQMTKEKIILQIKNLINSYYLFLGYIQFANYIIKVLNSAGIGFSDGLNTNQITKINPNLDEKNLNKINKKSIQKIRNEFNNRLIVIDEIQNIRKSDDNENKKVAINLELLVKIAKNMRFLLLSATPVYNSYKEIIWLLNLMNMNDKRSKLELKDIFDKKGNLKKNGKEMLIRKATGYISFVRGENPYTFPYRVYPNEFDEKNTFKNIEYPEYQMNLKKIKTEDKKRILNLYLTTIGGCNNCGKCQYCVYKYVIYYLRNKNYSITTKTGISRKMPNFENMETFGYTLLQIPLESLIISYPIENLKEILDEIPEEELSNEYSPSLSEINSEEIDKTTTPIENSAKPSSELFKEPSEELFKEPSEEPFKEPSEELFKEPSEEPFKEPSEELFKEPSEEPSAKPFKEPSAKPFKEPSEELFKEPSAKPFKEPSAKPFKEPSAKPFKEPSEELFKEPSEEPSEEPSAKPFKESSAKPFKEPSEEPFKEPSEEPFLENDENDENDEDEEIIIIPKNTTIKQKGGTPNNEIMINPNILTGKKGLERMLTFEDTSNFKGNFEYNKQTLNNYGKIFSPNEISKYSSKIKNILENIYNSKTNTISEGIVLIYSQYIDGGLIPMALALEEMGFTRYGDNNIKPLFKKKPTDVVDVRTMKPQQQDVVNNKDKDFFPARYSLITGDVRISPNNDFEVKGATNVDNKDGHKIKVILISKAGSEGIDFKFIRQVHILEPWYNMNRIEQTIGRAVRNFSHKDLDFEKRNVQIFLYGTILDKNIEEAADLYVYRIAEFKAIQMGKITRILKEVAVDCIINHEQTNFTKDVFQENIKRPIKQILANGQILNNFKIGDIPFSSACDYMDNCNYNCIPDKKITEKDINEDTYEEIFTTMNSDKIIQKIKLLFKEEFFFKKNILLKAIRTPKEYPYIQIYSALTQLIEDQNEFITDKYGRTGRLVNIGEYYLFQPLELQNNKNISLYERFVPLDYKNQNIQIELDLSKKNNIYNKQIIEEDVRSIRSNLNNNIEQNDNNLNEKIIMKNKNIKGQKIIDEINEQILIIKEYTQKENVPRGDDDWLKHCGIAIQKITTDFSDIEQYINYFIIVHCIESLLYEDKLDIINYLYSLENIENNSTEWNCKEYFERISIVTKKYIIFILYNLNKNKTMLLNKNINTNTKLIEATFEEFDEIKKTKEYKDYIKLDNNEYNNIIGFMGYEKSNKYLVFKTKNLTAKRDTGARCNEAGKPKIIEKLNSILGEEKYTKDNTKLIKEKNKITQNIIGQIELCIIMEFTLRYFEEIKKDNKKWILTPEKALLYGIYKLL